MLAECRGKRGVLEFSATDPRGQRRVAREICFDDIEISSGSYPRRKRPCRPGLAVALRAQPASRLCLREGAVPFILIKRLAANRSRHKCRADRRFEIGGEHAEAERSVGLENSGALGNIGERAFAVCCKTRYCLTADERRRAAPEATPLNCMAPIRQRTVAKSVDVFRRQKGGVAVRDHIGRTHTGVHRFPACSGRGFFAVTS